MWVPVKARRSTLGVFYSLLYFFEVGSHLTWSLPFQLDWLAIKSPGFTCLSPNPQCYIDMHVLAFRWVLGIHSGSDIVQALYSLSSHKPLVGFRKETKDETYKE